MANLLKTAFPHLSDNQIKITVEGLFNLDQDIPAFKDHLRDFLVQIRVSIHQVNYWNFLFYSLTYRTIFSNMYLITYNICCLITVTVTADVKLISIINQLRKNNHMLINLWWQRGDIIADHKKKITTFMLINCYVAYTMF